MFDSLEDLARKLAATGYFIDPGDDAGRLSGREAPEASAA